MIRRLIPYGPFDHVIWVAPEHAPASPSDGMLIEAREQGMLEVFRLVKTLLALDYGVRDLTWTLVTRSTQPALPSDVVNPTHAALHGLAGSMAKEYPHWQVRLLDVEAGADLPVEVLLDQPVDPGGNARAYRDGIWYTQALVPVQQLTTAHQRYRRHGVYVVIGGAGGIGEAWSRFVIETYDANLVWIGRRSKDAAIRAKLEALAALGHAPLYISADATERAALERAYQEIKQCFGHVHGLVHSAIVLDDQGLAAMDEARFRAALAAKMDVSVRMAQVFQHEALDFVLFFSSLRFWASASSSTSTMHWACRSIRRSFSTTFRSNVWPST
jgi:polyketide synthase PksN